MEAIKEIFRTADKDGSQLVDMDEWLKACKEKDGDKYKEADAKASFKDIDKTESGSISLAELDLWVHNKQLDAVRTRFKNADSSGDRKLDHKEFDKFFKAEGMKKKAIEKLWKKCDKNGDGKVSYSEFSEWMEREMADGVLKETFGNMFEDDEKERKKILQAKKDKK